MQVIEQRRTTSQPYLVIFMGGADACDQSFDSTSLRAAELVVFQINVVDDLGNWSQRAAGESKMAHQYFKCAAVPLVRKFRFEHVETDLAWLEFVSARRDEFELCRCIDKPPDEPRAGDSIDVNSLARHPHTPAILAASASIFSFARSLRVKTGFQAGNQTF